jgi:hypothetical protein
MVIGVVGVRCKRGVRTHTRNDTDFDNINKSREKGRSRCLICSAQSSSCHLCEPLLSHSLNYSSQYTDPQLAERTQSALHVQSAACALCALCLVITLRSLTLSNHLRYPVTLYIMLSQIKRTG